MITSIVAALSPALVASGGLSGAVQQVEAQSQVPLVRREFPLNCRGGAGLVFDTLIVVSDSAIVRLLLTFAANPAASGPEGQELQPGSCAWMDRPLSDAEPRRILFTIGTTDCAPQQTVRDSGMYWGFLAYNSDGGNLTGVGYRHWHASSAPLPQAAQVAVTSSVSTPAAWKIGRFDLRYLPLIGLAWLTIAWAPMMMFTGRWSGWRRIAETYPDRNARRGGSFRSGQLIMGRTIYRGGVRFTSDESHLHFAMSVLLRPGHPPFSVPWPEIEAAPAEWPWFPFKGEPMVRLTPEAHPDIRILMKVRDAKRITEGSGGRFLVHDPRTRPMAAHR